MQLVKLDEPNLEFRHQQKLPDPRDGLTLFGPLDLLAPFGIRAGAIGTTDGLRKFREWVQRIQRPIINQYTTISRPYYPGFEAAFRIPWSAKPIQTITIDQQELARRLHLDDRHQRVYQSVQLFSAPIATAGREEEHRPDVWFVIIPDDVYKYCRPMSTVEPQLRQPASNRMKVGRARKLGVTPSLFREENLQAVPYQYEPDFHNQLKAQVLDTGFPTQIIKESTIAPHEYLKITGKPIRDLDAVASDIAWTLSSSAYYKTGGRPWKIADIRPGVCYLGLVFKKDDRQSDPRAACCAAQLFLDSGDGVVFRGALGPWYSPKTGDFHLSREAAAVLLTTAIQQYKAKAGTDPRELFVHGKVGFSDEEWRGFTAAAPRETNVVGIRIKDGGHLKLYRTGDHAVLRGLALIESNTTAYLWTKGFIPRLQTYPGRGVPNPLQITIVHGRADIQTVTQDVMALTKVNYNTCIFADGNPVTLIFADAIGEILTAGPTAEKVPPLPFKMYI